MAFVKSNPEAALAAGVIATTGVAITHFAMRKTHDKGVYDTGKIAQQYTDKAKTEQLLA